MKPEKELTPTDKPASSPLCACHPSKDMVNRAALWNHRKFGGFKPWSAENVAEFAEEQIARFTEGIPHHPKESYGKRRICD